MRAAVSRRLLSAQVPCGSLRQPQRKPRAQPPPQPRPQPPPQPPPSPLPSLWQPRSCLPSLPGPHLEMSHKWSHTLCGLVRLPGH